MNQEQKIHLVDALLSFVERAASTGATTEEIAALAEVADVLVAIERISF